jgi:hypothetical protein
MNSARCNIQISTAFLTAKSNLKNEVKENKSITATPKRINYSENN